MRKIKKEYFYFTIAIALALFTNYWPMHQKLAHYPFNNHMQFAWIYPSKDKFTDSYPIFRLGVLTTENKVAPMPENFAGFMEFISSSTLAAMVHTAVEDNKITDMQLQRFATLLALTRKGYTNHDILKKFSLPDHLGSIPPSWNIKNLDEVYLLKGHIMNSDKPKEVAVMNWEVCGKLSFDPTKPKGERAKVVELDGHCKTKNG